MSMTFAATTPYPFCASVHSAGLTRDIRAVPGSPDLAYKRAPAGETENPGAE